MWLGTLRALSSREIKLLIQSGNRADNWQNILVSDPFYPECVDECRFYGQIRIGPMLNGGSTDLREPPSGFYRSEIAECQFGSGVCVRNVGWMQGTQVGDGSVLMNIGSILSCGELHRFWIEIANENGARRIQPFIGVRPSDAALWARFRGNEILMARFKEMTDRMPFPRTGTIGRHCVMREIKMLRNVIIGDNATVCGADNLEDVCVLSHPELPTSIGSGVELIDGFLGYGSKVGFGCRAKRFVLGERVTLAQGAKLEDVFLGDHSVIEGCEVRNSLIFPFHAQHHQSSFLIASTIEGQSNVAAGAIIGSNHNSRKPDGELYAERGFWPGLCTSFVFPSSFAPYTLVVKGDYHYPLSISLPFCLIANDKQRDALILRPAFWLMWNMFALMRNNYKFVERDQRFFRTQPIESKVFAPDTVNGMLYGMKLLERWVGQAAMGKTVESKNVQACEFAGRHLLLNDPQSLDQMELWAKGIEISKRPVYVLQPAKAYQAYKKMTIYYAVCELIDQAGGTEIIPEQWVLWLRGLEPISHREETQPWINLGGQLVSETQLEELITAIQHDRIAAWHELHEHLNRLWVEYPLMKARHALSVLGTIEGLPVREWDAECWCQYLESTSQTALEIVNQMYDRRRRDFEDPGRTMTFLSAAERDAVYGTLNEDTDLLRVDEDTRELVKVIYLLINYLKSSEI